MEKLIYLLWKPADVAIQPFRDELTGSGAQEILAAGATALNVSVADLFDEIPRPALLMGDGATLSAVVSLWLDCLDDRGPIEDALRKRSERLDGFLVTESVPQVCSDRDWPDGTRSPGLTHFTWFPKPERLSDEEFFRGWHDQHSPLSFDLHPLRWEYVRNSVARGLTPGSPPIRAIVVERFRTLTDYTDPKRLYGGPEVMKRMLDELPNFGDMDAMHSVPLSEFILKS